MSFGASFFPADSLETGGGVNFSAQISLKADLWSGVFVAAEDVVPVSSVGIAGNIGGAASAAWSRTNFGYPLQLHVPECCGYWFHNTTHFIPEGLFQRL